MPAIGLANTKIAAHAPSTANPALRAHDSISSGSANRNAQCTSAAAECRPNANANRNSISIPCERLAYMLLVMR